MIKLALEIPKAHLEEFWGYCDYDFVLAQYILDDEDYRRFYQDVRKKDPNRYCILDNGFHELGRPLQTGELIEAAKLLNPHTIVAPDWLDDPKRTIQAIREFRQVVATKQLPFKVCGVLQGDTPEHAFRMYDAIQSYVDALGLPFKKNRAPWLAYNPRMYDKVIHLLGGKELTEIDELRLNRPFTYHEAHVHIDTAKPIKWAMRYQRLDTLESIRSSGVREHDFYNTRLNETQVSVALTNIKILRDKLA